LGHVEAGRTAADTCDGAVGSSPSRDGDPLAGGSPSFFDGFRGNAQEEPSGRNKNQTNRTGFYQNFFLKKDLNVVFPWLDVVIVDVMAPILDVSVVVTPLGPCVIFIEGNI
jgi:hypothetical protein